MLLTAPDNRASVVFELDDEPRRVSVNRTSQTALAIEIGPISAPVSPREWQPVEPIRSLVDRVRIDEALTASGERSLRARLTVPEHVHGALRLSERRVYLDLSLAARVPAPQQPGVRTPDTPVVTPSGPAASTAQTVPASRAGAAPQVVGGPSSMGHPVEGSPATRADAPTDGAATASATAGTVAAAGAAGQDPVARQAASPAGVARRTAASAGDQQAELEMYLDAIGPALARFEEVEPFLRSAAESDGPDVLAALAATLKSLHDSVAAIEAPEHLARQHARLAAAIALAARAADPGFTGDRVADTVLAVGEFELAKAAIISTASRER